MPRSRHGERENCELRIDCTPSQPILRHGEKSKCLSVYGGSDKYIGLATIKLKELLNYILQYFPISKSVARVPLAVKLPGMKRSARIRPIVQPWDMAPTILELFGIGAAKKLIGKSLLPLIRGKTNKSRDVAVVGDNDLAQAMNSGWIYSTWQRPTTTFPYRSEKGS